MQKKFFIDVRTPVEFHSGSVPGAINVPLDSIETIEEYGVPKDAEIILFCRSGARSEVALNILKKMGFIHAKNGGSVYAAGNL